ncbi:MAG: FAD-dependent oxidoreductase [bacterium]
MSNEKSGREKVAILGGGITGLTLADALSGRGYSVELFEAAAGVGGLASTVEWDGFRFDHGPHEFCTDNPELIGIAKDVLGEDYILKERKACQYFRGSEIAYPFAFTDLLKCVGVRMLSRTAAEVFLGRLKNIMWQQEDFSFRKWTESRYGKTLYAELFEPYTKKVWGVDPEKLDPRTASKRITFNSIFDYIYQYFLLRFKREQSRNPHSPMRWNFIYAQRGIGTLCDRLAGRARAHGARIHLESRVTGMELKGDNVKAIEVDGEPFSDFDLIVSTLPLTTQLEMLNYRMPQLIRFRSMAFVFLKVPLEKMRDWLWTYFPDPGTIFQRTVEFGRFDAGMCPPGHTGLCAEISYFPEDEIGRMTDKELVERTIGDLKRDGFLPDNITCEGMVRRTDYAYPIQFNGYIEWVSMMMEPIAKIENLIITGRQALYKYCNMNECMEMALEVADGIATGNQEKGYSSSSGWKGAGIK